MPPPGLLPFYAAALVLVLFAVYAFRRRTVRGARWYGALLLALALWCVTYALELATPGPDEKLLILKFKYIGLLALPIAWLGFVLDFLGSDRAVVLRAVRVAAAISATLLLIACTNELHQLFWGDLSIVTASDGLSVTLARGPGFWTSVVYLYTSLWGGVGVMVARALQSPYLFRRRVSILIAAAVLPWVSSVMFLARHRALEHIDPTPLLLTVTALAAAIAVFKYRVPDMMPSLRDAQIAVIGDGLLILDRSGRIADMNRAAERILARARADVAGRAIQDVLPGIEPPQGDGWRQDIHIPGPRGERIFDTRVTPLRSGRELTGYVLVLHDVTERRDLEEQLRQAQKMEAVGKLAGGVAHDFNNLLTAIIGFATLAEEDVGDSPARDALVQIRRSAEQAALLTRQLLAFGRRQILQPEVLELNTIVSNVEPMLRRLIGEDITVVTELAPDLPRVRADRSQLQQVLLNLAVNARDAMPTGGVLTIRTTTTTLREDRSAGDGLRAGDYAVLEVSDTGEGITEDVLERIFEPFFTTKPFGKGTGLGLSTVYGIVKQSGGDVQVRTESGRGTTFAVLLPAAESPLAPAAPAPSESARAEANGHVLLVEDDAGVREFIEEVLRAGGWKVLSAASPSEALAIAARQSLPIDLLITDLIMPSMNGDELAERLVALRPGLRVLYISGYPDDEIAARGLLVNGRDCLSKPFTPGELRRHVQALLERAP